MGNSLVNETVDCPIDRGPKLFKDFILQFPYPIIFGWIFASVIASSPLIATTMQNWVRDIGKYGLLFPFFWIGSLLILLFSRLTALYYENQANHGLHGFLSMFAVATVMAIISYLSTFLLICLAEVFNEELKSFLSSWGPLFLIGCLISALWILIVLRENPLKAWDGESVWLSQNTTMSDLTSWMNPTYLHFFPSYCYLCTSWS